MDIKYYSQESWKSIPELAPIEMLEELAMNCLLKLKTTHKNDNKLKNCCLEILTAMEMRGYTDKEFDILNEIVDNKLK